MAEHEDVRLGMRVRDMSGELLGKVVRMGTGRFLIQQGTVIKESLIVPDDRVAAVNDGEVVLNCSYRDLLEAMRNPPMEEELALAEKYRYAEMGISSTRAEAVPEREGSAETTRSARVVRDEIAVNPGSAHQHEVRPSEEQTSPDPQGEGDPERPLH